MKGVLLSVCLMSLKHGSSTALMKRNESQKLLHELEAWLKHSTDETQ
jgi:hypothetical protein